MKTFSFIRLKLIAIFLVCCCDLAFSQTVRTFDDTTGALYSPWQCDSSPNAPPPLELPGGPSGTGKFLRLATTFVYTNNSITFDRTDPGLFSEITAEFDFRMTPGSGRADGLGFALLNTAFTRAVGGFVPRTRFMPRKNRTSKNLWESASISTKRRTRPSKTARITRSPSISTGLRSDHSR